MGEASMKKRDERLFVPTDELGDGWHKTIAELKPWLWLGAIAALLSMCQQALSRSGAAAASMRPLLILCVDAMQVAVTLAAFRTALRVADDQPIGKLEPSVLLARYFPFLLTHILVALIVAVGMVLLIVPGVLWALTYGFAPMLCAAEGYDPIESLRESRRITAGHRRTLFLFGLLCLGVNLLGALALGIGLFVTVPTTVIAMAHVLRRLQQAAPRPTVHNEATPFVPGAQVPAH
jgi:uncharacterized membrane protein